MVFLTFLSAACSTPYVAPPDAELRGPAAAAADSGSDVSVDSGAGADTALEDSGEVVPPPPAPCTLYGATEQTGIVGDDSLNEISGLAASRRNPGVFWVMEDHAAPNEVHAIDEAGNVLGRVVLDGAENHDWEDVAVGTCGETTCLFVGDIGDNDHDRTWHGVLRIQEPEVLLSGGLDLTMNPDVFAYVFPDDGHWDSEALAIQPDGIPVLFTKEYDTEHSTAYTFPSLDTAATVTLVERGRFETGAPGEAGGAATTAADLWPDGSRLILRTYAHIWEFTLTPAGLDDLEDAARVELYTGAERQGESIAYDPFNRAYYTLSEDVNPPLYRTDCGDGL